MKVTIVYCVKFIFLIFVLHQFNLVNIFQKYLMIDFIHKEDQESVGKALNNEKI